MNKAVKNNFDMSSTGKNIECTCFLDGDIAQSNFTENFEILQHDGYTKTAVCYYIDNRNLPKSETVKFTVLGQRAVREKYFIDNGRYYDPEEVQTWDDETLNSEILSNEKDVNLINYALNKMPNIEGIEFMPNKPLIILTTRGYSQGDYAKVIYCPADCENVWGNMPEQSDIQKTIDHYYWDCPIYAVFTIDKEEYCYHDMPNYDEHTWERDKFIDYVAEQSKTDRTILSELVLQYPEYQ